MNSTNAQKIPNYMPYDETKRIEDSAIFLAKVFNWMMIGLGLTALIAFSLEHYGYVKWLVQRPILFYGAIVFEFILVICLSARIDRIDASTATFLFMLYSALNGVTFSLIVAAYTSESIASVFLITSCTFGAMALYGYVTKSDLDSLGAFMYMGLMGIIIASIVNLFLHSSTVYWVCTYIGVIVFVGLTAYDVQKIKKQAEAGILSDGEETVQKAAILGALELYLDFINLFLHLLAIFGKRE